jgi:hypothetical protein
MRLTKEQFRRGKYPAVWMRASGVVIRKPVKDDYTKLKGFRAISPQRCLQKEFEKMVAVRLPYDTGRSELLSN